LITDDHRCPTSAALPDGWLGVVRFFLHPSCGKEVAMITVGALADNDTTLLELDLTEDSTVQAPHNLRSR
jgi:hypothetical protein